MRLLRSVLVTGVLVGALSAAGGCGGGNVPGRESALPSAKAGACTTSKAPISDTLLDSLSVLATETPRDRTKYPSVASDAELDRYIDALVDEPRFAKAVAPSILISRLVSRAGATDLASVLSVDTSGPVPLYWLRKKCDPAKAEDVHPWWALETTVKVCPDSHQPTHLRVPETGTWCGAAPSIGYCGCGPNLALCVRDGKQRQAILDGMKLEATSLVARVVSGDAPLEEIFLANETERDRNVEYVYRRWRISAGEPPMSVLGDLAKWPETPVRAPRFESTPQQHAGVLTTAGSLGLEMSRRARMKWFYEALWCDEPPGGSVTTSSVLALPPGDLREGDGWQKLAAMPICTECHARLDYGAQFFTGFGTVFAYDPKSHVSGPGKLFGRNIEDPRGEAELSPHSFAQLAVSQREFSACIVRDVKRRVLPDPMNAADDRPLDEAFARGHSLKSLMRAALHTYADRERTHECASPASAAPKVTVEAMLQTHCNMCHGAKRPPDFRSANDPETLKRALTQVAFGAMPKAPSAMPSTTRTEMVELLIQRIWSDPAAQSAARSYFEDSRALPVHSLKGMLNAVDTHANVTPGETDFDRAAEQRTKPDLLRYSPGVAAIVHLEALKACKAAGKTGAELTTCVEHASEITRSLRTTSGLNEQR